MTEIIRVATAQEIIWARELFREYENYLGIDLDFQGFQAEMEGLPGKYAPPTGAILLALVEAEPAGCVAVRELEATVCEMKRLYVRERFRGLGLGKQLAQEIIAEGRRLGYRAMRLDTLESLREAHSLYRRLGFRAIDAYYPNPLAGAVYMELGL